MICIPYPVLFFTVNRLLLLCAAIARVDERSILFESTCKRKLMGAVEAVA